MHCTEFLLSLEREPDGPLSPSAAGHLDRCPRCRLLFDDLEGIRLASFEWAIEQPEPSPRIWQALRSQLEAEGLIRPSAPTRLAAKGRNLQPARGAANDGSTTGWGLRPALAALPLLLVAVALLHLPAEAPASIARASTISALPAATASGAPLAEEINRNLDTDIRRVMSSLPPRRPALTSALQQNLAIVDNMIATCEKSVREQPNNPMVREYLYGAYQQKAVLLSTALERTALEAR